MPTDRRTADLARSIALGTTATAVVGVPTLGPLVLKTRENVERYDTAITPPGYAFAVWAPIFAGIVANAAQAALPGRSRLPENRKTGWPLAGAYALNTAWSVAAQSDRFGYTPALLPAAVALTGVAYRRIQSVPSDKDSISSVSTGLLLGWTGLAATVNLSAGTQLLGADATSKTSVVGSTLAALGAAGVLAAVVGRSRRGTSPSRHLRRGVCSPLRPTRDAPSRPAWVPRWGLRRSWARRRPGHSGLDGASRRH